MDNLAKGIQNVERNQGDVFPQFQNGRVIDIAEKPTEWFQLFDNNQPNTEFTRKALFGIQDCSQLSKIYFSKANVKLVQDMLRYNVWLKSDKKYVIGEQSTVELEIVMRSVYLQHARNLPYKIKEQVRELNNIAIHQMTPRVISEVEQYLGYLWQVEQLPVPIEWPKNMSSAGTNLLRSVTTTF